jgi:hypothetical protein
MVGWKKKVGWEKKRWDEKKKVGCFFEVSSLQISSEKHFVCHPLGE